MEQKARTQSTSHFPLLKPILLRFCGIFLLGLLGFAFHRYQSMTAQKIALLNSMAESQELSQRLAQAFAQGDPTEPEPSLIFVLKEDSLLPLRGALSELRDEETKLLQSLPNAPGQWVSLAGQTYLVQKSATSLALHGLRDQEFWTAKFSTGAVQHLLVTRQLDLIASQKGQVHPFDWERSELRRSLQHIQADHGVLTPDFLSTVPLARYRAVPGTNLLLVSLAASALESSLLQKVWYRLKGLGDAFRAQGEHATLLISSPRDGERLLTKLNRLSLTVSWLDGKDESPYRVYVWKSGELRKGPYAETQHAFFQVEIEEPGSYWLQVEGAQRISEARLFHWQRQPIRQKLSRSTGDDDMIWDKNILAIAFPEEGAHFLGGADIPLVIQDDGIQQVVSVELIVSLNQKAESYPLDPRSRSLTLWLVPGTYEVYMRVRAHVRDQLLTGRTARVRFVVDSPASGMTLWGAAERRSFQGASLWFFDWPGSRGSIPLDSNQGVSP